MGQLANAGCGTRMHFARSLISSFPSVHFKTDPAYIGGTMGEPAGCSYSSNPNNSSSVSKRGTHS
jgi:hypothetical protein